MIQKTADLRKTACLAFCLELPVMTDALLYLPCVWKERKATWPRGCLSGWNKHVAEGVVTNLGRVMSALCDIKTGTYC